MACTLNTRYEDGAVSDYISLAHYPKTVVRYVYENKGVCLDCYNQKWNKRVHITITARYDDSNKFVTQAYERR